MIAQPSYSISVADEAAWDRLVARFPDRTVFHTMAWLKTASAVHGLKIVLAQAHQCVGDAIAPRRAGINACSLNGQCEPVAVWPYLEMKKGPLRVIGSPLPGWSTAYMGPLFASGADVSGIMSAFLNDRLFRRYAYCACKVIDRSRPIDLSQFGFLQVMKFDTYLIDLTQPQETLWANLKGECRTRIRKAQKLGIEVQIEPGPEFIDDYWAMSIETFQKSNIQPTHNKQFVQEMWARLQPQRRVHAISAFVGGERAGTLMLPFDDQTMYYWGGASFLKYRDLPAHNLLHWEAICLAKQHGLKEYDFISTIGGPGRFKKTFGPRTIDMATHWERSPSRLLGALKKRYQSYLLKRRRVHA
ncbi:MAG: GNAT family N-acetyltransferase [Phycisphaerales bacterium]|nr:GNAT family N-acetyltransferase [Phycisphaerales bacterium]MCI0629908.1 GNAT family N-acetyltransferase [Phycisphaerales bacterium]MCI0677145.1 GNAT family N-acetyltransferase [Phycisphaerales bacterium]